MNTGKEDNNAKENTFCAKIYDSKNVAVQQDALLYDLFELCCRRTCSYSYRLSVEIICSEPDRS